MTTIQTLIAEYGNDFATHVIYSTLVLLVSLSAAIWIRPLTARTRHAILIAGMAALLIPPAMLTRIIESLSGPVAEFPVKLPTLGGVLPATAAVTEQSSFPWIEAMVMVWIVVGVLLFARWFTSSRRLVISALRSGSAPPPRAALALERARRRLALGRSVDLIASPVCEAPAVVRVLRPLIVLPQDGCEALDDDELESLLCHECAHVARRDNLLGVFEALVCSVFWFNPLVWLAHRRIGTEREAACDERVAENATSAEAYVGALAKFCQTLVVPRIAAVSCMASAHLKERIQHLMRYPSLREKAFSHRVTTLTASVAVLFLVTAAAVVTADPLLKKSGDRYVLNYSVGRMQDGALAFRSEIIDTENKEVIGQPAVMTRGTTPAAAEISREDRRWRVDVTPDAGGGGKIVLTAWSESTQVQRSTFTFGKLEVVPDRQYTGAPISMDLENADIRDVLEKFAKITDLRIIAEPNVQGRVTVHVRDTPWDQALDQVIRENGFNYRFEGGALRVFKPQK